MKNWIFDDPFHKKLPILGILVSVKTRTSGLQLYLRKLGFRLRLWANEVAEAAEVNEAGRFLRPGKSLLRTSESSRLLNLVT